MVTPMPNGRGRSAKVVMLEQQEQTQTVPKAVEESPLFGVAMLKIAMELKKAEPRPLDELVTGVLQRMGLPESEFRAFLESNGGLLRSIATKRGY
jgi:hypothetical protein